MLSIKINYKFIIISEASNLEGNFSVPNLVNQSVKYKDTSSKLDNTRSFMDSPNDTPIVQSKKPIPTVNQNDVQKKQENLKRHVSAISKTNSSDLLKAPSIDSREGFYPKENTETRGTSAPAFYTIKTASTPPTTKTKDKMNVSEMLDEFRNRVKIDNQNIKLNSSINLSDKQMRGFEYPQDMERSKIISGILDKQKKERERKILEAKMEWERKRRELKEKLRKEKLS